MSPHLTRRALGALAAASLLTLAACSTDTEPAATPEESTATTEGAFPVTVEHIWGETTVEAEPERVVVLGVTDADAVLALGVVPVAVQPFFAEYTSGVGPWAEDLVEGADIQVLEPGSENNVELVASLQPDLIIAVSSGFDQAIYDQLAQVAPTLARPAGTVAYGVDRDDATRAIGQVLGRAEQAEELIDTADAAFASAREANPEFAAATGTVILPFDGQYGAYTPVDARGRIMAELGFSLPADLAAEDDGSSFFVDVSNERLNLVDGDVLVVLVDSATENVVAEDAVLQALPVTEAGGLIVAEGALRGAMSYNTVLSAPFAVDELVPQLQAALG